MPEKTTDRELVRQILAGRQEAASELVRRHEKRAHNIAYGFTHSRQEALDLAQEAFLRMFRNLHRYNEEFEFSTWFYRIVINLAINHVRRKRVLTWIPLDLVVKGGGDQTENDMVEAIDRQEVVGRLRSAISALPERQKAAIILFDIEGFSIRETAKMIGCSEGTVMSRLHYGRRRLKELLEAAGIREIFPSSDRGGES